MSRARSYHEYNTPCACVNGGFLYPFSKFSPPQANLEARVLLECRPLLALVLYSVGEKIQAHIVEILIPAIKRDGKEFFSEKNQPHYNR